MGAIAGASTALVVGVLGFVLAVAYPDTVTQGDISTVDIGILTLLDFQFVTPEAGGTSLHVAPLVFDHFDQYIPPAATLGLLYVLPALVCYRAGNFVAGFRTDDDDSAHLDSALSGATIVAGYLPVMVVAGLLAPSDPVSIDLTTTIWLAGLVYPLLFGGLGGLVAGYYYPGELRVGQAYSAAILGLSLVLIFLTTFLTVENIPNSADEMVGRLVATVFLTVGALALELDVSGTALLPYVVTIGLFLGFGVLRVRRSPGVRSAAEGFAKGATLAPAYALYAAFLFSIGVALSDGYLFFEYQEIYAVVGAGIESDAIGGLFTFEGLRTVTFAIEGIGTFVETVVMSGVVYGAVAGGGGVLAWWYGNRNATGPAQQGAQQPPHPQQPQGGAGQGTDRSPRQPRQ